MAYNDFKAKHAYPCYLSVSLSLLECVTFLALSQHICFVFPDNLKRLPSLILYVPICNGTARCSGKESDTTTRDFVLIRY